MQINKSFSFKNILQTIHIIIILAIYSKYFKIFRDLKVWETPAGLDYLR